MTARFAQQMALAGLVATMVFASGCGDVSQGRSPAQVVIMSLEVASGATPGESSGTLQSDVITDGSILNDSAEVTMELRLKDPGGSGLGANPSELNSVTITRYRVSYVRTDGQNAQGVQVPYTFDSGLTFTIPADGAVTAEFQIVRHTAKAEAPLAALATSGSIISTIAEVTFYGRDLAGNDVVASARVGIDFGNFADPN